MTQPSEHPNLDVDSMRMKLNLESKDKLASQKKLPKKSSSGKARDLISKVSLPDIQRHYTSFLNPDQESYTVTNQRKSTTPNPYFVTVTRRSITYVDGEGVNEKEIVYNFKTGQITLNGNTKDAKFKQKFFDRLIDVGDDITAKKAVVYVKDKQ